MILHRISPSLNAQLAQALGVKIPTGQEPTFIKHPAGKGVIAADTLAEYQALTQLPDRVPHPDMEYFRNAIFKQTGIEPLPEIRAKLTNTEAAFFDPNSNPLLINSEFPQWDKIKPEHIVPAISQLAIEFRLAFAEFETALAQNPHVTFNNIFPALNNMMRQINYAMKQADHLMGAMKTDALEEACLEAQQIMVGLSQTINQSQALYQAVLKLKEGPEWFNLTDAERRVVVTKLNSMKNGGIALKDAKLKRFNEIDTEMTKIVTDFVSNATKSKHAFELIVTDKTQLAGLSGEDLKALADNYNTRKELKEDDPQRATKDHGPWMITLDDSTYGALMRRADDASLRKSLYQARSLIASAKNPYDQGQYDNAANAKKIIQLSGEQAKLLGHKTYAEWSQSQKMLGSLEAANVFMEELLTAAKPVAQKDNQELLDFAQRNGHQDPLQPWDKSYYFEKLQKQKFDFNDETIKAYLSLPKVIDGVVSVVAKLFGVNIEDHTGEVPAYSKDVRFYKIVDGKTNTVISAFYFDPYERNDRNGSKRSGAWMDNFVSYRTDQNGKVEQIPIALLTTNFAKPVDGNPSRLTLGDAETLIHELGHGLQHMLTKVRTEDAAGINNVEWDAVEIASQFMEYWIYQPEILKQISSHVETGQPFDDELIAKIRGARTFGGANATLRQLLFAMTDMALYSTFDPHQDKESIYDVYKRIHQKVYGHPPAEDDYFLNNFLHIFSGDSQQGYKAGYVTYKVSETLAADYFSAFEPFLDDPAAVRVIGERLLKTLYEMGGGVHPRDVFRAFMGRDYNIDALLRHSGLK